MPLSSSTLIHFTNDKDALKGILRENFKIHYCRENLMLGAANLEFLVPMVSFCDIPLSQVKSHIESYGKYGIGLTKDWGMKNRLNPVLYMAAGSNLSHDYERAFSSFITSDDSPWTRDEQSLANMLRYMKNYEGDLVRTAGQIDNYRFSDEREWRYVPPVETACDMLVLHDDSDANFRINLDEKLKNLRLNFEPNDIKYIIIQDDSEIEEFFSYLGKVKGKYAHEDVIRLTTRILTTEQIYRDI